MNPDTLSIETIDLFGIQVAAEDPAEILERILDRAVARLSTKVYYVNAHVFNLAEADDAFRRVLEDGDVVVADGYGARFAARLLNYPVPKRLAITDYIWEFAESCAARGVSVFIVSGEPGVAERARKALEARYPKLDVAGTHHGFVKDPAVTQDVVRRINESKADVVCVGMGSPIQEQWIAEHAASLSAPVVFAVGAVMDFVSGEVQRPRPKWMSDTGLEWVSRLVAEPKRMWRRYLLGNPRFVARTLRKRWSR